MIKKNKGFTLIELFVIISIFGILSLMSVSVLIAYRPTIQLNGSVRGLISDLRQAQQLTVTEQIEHSVYLIAAEKRYEIRRYGETTSTIKEVSFPSAITEITITGLTDADTNKEARYNPYGAVADQGAIIVKNSSNATTSVEVKPSGFVKIVK